MKKRIGIIMISVLLILAVGCNSSKPSVTPETDYLEGNLEYTPINEEEDSYEQEDVTAETYEEVREEEPKPEEEDPFDVLAVTEDFARKYGLTVIARNGKLYSTSVILKENQKKYNIGISRIFDYVNQSDLDVGVMCKGSSDKTVILGELPELVLNEGDEIRAYGGYSEMFYPVEYTGYVPRFFATSRGYIQVYLTGPSENVHNVVGIKGSYVNCVMKCEGNTLIETDDWNEFTSFMGSYAYEKGKLYDFDWIADFKNEGFSDYAVCRTYKWTDKRGTMSDEGRIKVGGEINTEDQYSVLDVSSLPSGQYMWIAAINPADCSYGVPVSIN